MAIRFQRTPASTRRSERPHETNDDFGHWWAAIAIIGVAIMAVLSLGGGASSPRLGIAPENQNPAGAILASLQTAEHALSEIDENMTSLCHEPVLVALELEPDCRTGTITISDELFVPDSGGQLTPAAREDVAAAVAAYLGRLRRMPAIWESLEAREIRGHADPRAFRNAYQTNLVGSQQRALGVLLFLVGPDGLSTADRSDLERLAIVSGASYSRPPESCPEATRLCYTQWRRVEIRPILSEALRRNDWARTLESVRVTAQRAQKKAPIDAP